MGARFEALDEGVLMAPLDPRYTQVGFNSIFVQVCVGLVPKIIPTKFHPNPSTFGTTLVAKTDERRRTPCKLGVASRLWVREASPPLGVASQLA